MRKMTKAEALADFREIWDEVVANNPRARGDSIMKREAFNNYTDALCKDRRITPHQYETWSNPF